MNNFWEFFKYLLLGLVQGFTEPLPISSSGHMIIVDHFFNNIIAPEAMNNFQIIVNTASLIAIIFYYRSFLKEILVGSWNYLFYQTKEDKEKFNYLVLIVLASIPAGIVGLIIKIYELDHYFSNIVCVAICLFITGLLLFYVHKHSSNSSSDKITWKDALFMGGGQAIGLLPGISRSGITSSFGISRGITVSSAFRFSFMMYIPASIAATILGLLDITNESRVNIPGYIGAFITSMIATYIAVRLFFKLLKKGNLKYFAYYCLIIASILIILLITEVI
ncbi:MAG: undecaprenyl-diphosphate phosphatase [Bacilli bacterium]|nr:undecaprenyl-diphosphate phosphatase [Bacilli bacterium]